jgi:hypothetical protein
MLLYHNSVVKYVKFVSVMQLFQQFFERILFDTFSSVFIIMYCTYHIRLNNIFCSVLSVLIVNRSVFHQSAKTKFTLTEGISEKTRSLPQYFFARYTMRSWRETCKS